MHEAQTPDDGAYIEKLNSVDSSQSSEGTTNPFDSILVGENKARELLLLAPASKETQLNQAVNSFEEDEVIEDEDIDYSVEVIIDSQSIESSQLHEETNSKCDREDEWVAEPNAGQQAIVDAEFRKLLELNEELRSANSKLYEQVEQLTTALSESEAALQRQKKRSNVAESMFNQQTTELIAAQEQIQSLFEQLENAVQNTQRQESLADSYKKQLELSQQRVAQLERESALIQTKYTEQTRFVTQSENTCRELRTRLKRQQRQTLQFKAALEKSLETSIPSYNTDGDGDTKEVSSFANRIFPEFATNSQYGKLSQTQAVGSIQSIKPWSASEDFYKTPSGFWQETIATSTNNGNENRIQEESSSWEFSANSDIEIIQDTNVTHTEDSVNDDSVNDDWANKEATVPQVVLPPDSSELEEKLDSVIETFFASQTESGSQQSHLEQDAETQSPITQSWKTVIEPRRTNNNKNDQLINVETHQNSDGEEEHTVSFSSEMNYDSTSETGDYWEEISHFPAFDLSEKSASFEIISDSEHHTNSPSPLIYPKRPPKGRKSFASVELPKFPQNNDPA
jgi:hypothetical protein